ncbi:MAG: chorismate mutase [Deltaproteobacteria bacterium]|nr:chorismate mutase [Deltaproteobacteria bacterium]
MRSLDQVRADFDDVDDALLVLVQRRLELAREAGAIKRAAGIAVHDPAREQAGLQKRQAWCAAAGVDVDVVDRMFALLIEASRAAQR